MKAFALSNIGNQRERNEDSYLLDPVRHLFVICDGMGGHKGGDVASNLAVDTIRKKFKKIPQHYMTPKIIHYLMEAAWLANYKILTQSRDNEELTAMGTTLTAVYIDEKNLMTVAHVGDSSLYLYRESKLFRITREHTLAEKMVDNGELSREDLELNAYKHVLTRALGIDHQLKVDIIQRTLLPRDILLLCSDGLTDLIDDAAIYNILITANPIENTCEQLVNKALHRGGFDNITVLLVEIE